MMHTHRCILHSVFLNVLYMNANHHLNAVFMLSNMRRRGCGVKQNDERDGGKGARVA